MNFVDLKKNIEELQDKFPVSKWEIDDIYIWPLIQIQLGYILTSESDLLTNKNRNGILDQLKSTVLSLYYQLQATLKDRSSNIKPNKSYDVILHTLSSDRILLKDKYYTKLTEPLIDILNSKNISVFNIECLPLPIKYNTPRYGKSFYIQHKLLFARIKSIYQLKILKRRYNYESLDRFNEFCIYLEEQYNISSINANSLNDKIILLINLKKAFRKLLIKVKPKLCLTTMYYSIDGMALVNACHDLKIQTCDIQHGVQGEFHLAYGIWKNLPVEGYNLLPNVFINWSEEETNTINRWNEKVRDIHYSLPIGNLWLEKWFNSNDEIVKYYDRRIESIKITNTINVLYTLQNNVIPNKILKIMEEHEEIKWWIRMHPSFSQKIEDFEKIVLNKKIKNISIIEATKVPLMALMRHMDIHITDWSSSVKEAARFNIPSIVLHQNGVDIFKDEINAGKAFIGLRENNIIGAIKRVKIPIERKYKSNVNLDALSLLTGLIQKPQ